MNLFVVDSEITKLRSAGVTPGVTIVIALLGFIVGMCAAGSLLYVYQKRKKNSIPSSPHYMSAKQNPYITLPLHDRPFKRQSASTSNNVLNNVHNGTLKSKCYDYDTATIKRNSHGLNNGHAKQELMSDDKFLYE